MLRVAPFMPYQLQCSDANTTWLLICIKCTSGQQARVHEDPSDEVPVWYIDVA